jgi:hypothetical protein
MMYFTPTFTSLAAAAPLAALHSSVAIKSWAAVLIVLVVLLVLIKLITSPSTRVATWVLLAVGLLLVPVLAVGWLFTARVQMERSAQEATIAHEVQAMEAHAHRMRESARASIDHERRAMEARAGFEARRARVTALARSEEPIAEVPAEPAPSPTPDRSVLRALTKAFAKGFDPDNAKSSNGATTPAAAPAVPKPQPMHVEKEPSPWKPDPDRRKLVVLSRFGQTTRTMTGSFDRPKWVEDRPGLKGDNYCMTALTVPYSTLEERKAETDKALTSALAEYVRAYLGSEAADEVTLPAERLWNETVRECFEEPVEPPPGMDQALTVRHLRMEFDPLMQERLKDLWRETQNRTIVLARLWRAGTGLAAVLGVLTIAFGCLKIDQYSQGSRRVRLRMAVAVVMALVIGVVVMVS